jgi:hypothetical protein
LNDRGLHRPLLDSCVGVGRLEDRLLLMSGSLPEDTVQPQTNEESDKRKDDNDGQF